MIVAAAGGGTSHAGRLSVFGRGAIGKHSVRRASHWLALLAMLVQFVASYGHIHLDQYDALYQGHGAPTLAAPHGTTSAIGDPASADLDCPVCASMQILGSSAMPEGVHLSPPLSRHIAATAPLAALRLTPPRHLLFDTRGPPLA